jgi:hypothetical protein
LPITSAIGIHHATNRCQRLRIESTHFHTNSQNQQQSFDLFNIAIKNGLDESLKPAQTCQSRKRQIAHHRRVYPQNPNNKINSFPQILNLSPILHSYKTTDTPAKCSPTDAISDRLVISNTGKLTAFA